MPHKLSKLQPQLPSFSPHIPSTMEWAAAPAAAEEPAFLQSGVRPLAWSHYFDEADFTANDRRAQLIKELSCFLAGRAGWQFLSDGTKKYHGSVVVKADASKLLQLSRSSDLEEALRHSPKEALACISAAAYEVLFGLRCAEARAMLGLFHPTKVLLRLHNLGPAAFCPVSSIQAETVGRLVTVRGTINRATAVRPLVTEMPYTCSKCGNQQVVSFPDGKFVQPARCAGQGCRSRTFAPNTAAAKCVDMQRVQVQVRHHVSHATLSLTMHTSPSDTSIPFPRSSALHAPHAHTKTIHVHACRASHEMSATTVAACLSPLRLSWSTTWWAPACQGTW